MHTSTTVKDAAYRVGYIMAREALTGGISHGELAEACTVMIEAHRAALDLGIESADRYMTAVSNGIANGHAWAEDEYGITSISLEMAGAGKQP